MLRSEGNDFLPPVNLPCNPKTAGLIPERRPGCETISIAKTNKQKGKYDCVSRRLEEDIKIDMRGKPFWVRIRLVIPHFEGYAFALLKEEICFEIPNKQRKQQSPCIPKIQ